MEANRVWCARAVNPMKKDPPQCCKDSKTINFDTLQSRLFLFQDSRKEALAYVEAVLPTLVDTATSKEAAIHFYKSLEKNQWIEFDFVSNQLFLCSLKKSNP